MTASPPDILIRPPEPKDAARWRALWAGYLAFYRASVPEAATASTWARLLEPDGEIRGLVAERGGAVIGLCHFLLHASTWSPAPICYLQDLYVDPEARGSGVARALIEGCMERAAAAGAFRVYWQTQEYNAAARSLYDTITPRSSFIVYRKDL